MAVSHQAFARKKPDQLVYLELGSGNGGMLLSLSEDGFRFRAVTPLRPNGLVPFAFSLDGASRVQGVGEIEWLDDDGKSGGMRFSEISSESRVLLDRWLAVDSHHRSPGREITPAAATPLDTMEKIREELRRGYPARPATEDGRSRHQQGKSGKPAFSEEPSSRELSLKEPDSSLEEKDDSPPPPTAVPILERLMGPRRPTPLTPPAEAGDAHTSQVAPLPERSAPSLPAPAVRKLSDPPAPAPSHPPFSSSAFLKPRDAAPRESYTRLPEPPRSGGPVISPPPADSLPSLRSFRLTDTGDLRDSSAGSHHPPAPTSPSRSSAAEHGSAAYTPPSTPRPYIPPPDESLDAAWEHARLSAPPDTHHLSRAAAVSIIGLALAVILIAIAYNFRQDIGSLVIDVGRRISGRSEQPITSQDAVLQSGTGAQTPPTTDSAAAGATTNSDQPATDSGNSPSPVRPSPQPSPSAANPAESPPEASAKPASNKPAKGSSASTAKGSASNKPSNSSLAAKEDKSAAAPPSGASSATKAIEAPPDASAQSGESGTGQDEFNIARDILQGKDRRRELQTAIALLWSSVRKGNVPAEVTLADMYRRGEGVEKNCDQAQVLLVAASRKGSPDARRMLEIMAEQGCQ